MADRVSFEEARSALPCDDACSGARGGAHADAESATAQKSQLARAFSEDGARKTHVGGQALIEGVMMRGKYNWAVAVREPDGGMHVEEHDLASGRAKNAWMNWPLVRGCRALVESLVLGFKALEIASSHAFSEEGETAADQPASPERGGASEEAAGAFATPRSAVQDSSNPSGAALLYASDEAPSAQGEDGVQRVVQAPAASSDASADDDAATCGFVPFGAAARREFSWKDDFGHPDEAIEALGAQMSLEVVCEPASCVAVASEPTSGSAPAFESDSASRSASSSETKKGDSAANGKDVDDEGFEFGHTEMVISMVIGVVLGVALFIAVPAVLTNLIVGEYDQNTLAWNIVDGLLRVVVFVFYLWLIGRMSDIKRMFAYHGAEHKTIHCYEHGLPLTPENARRFPRLHVRCGTAFLIMVMIIAILVYTIVPLNPLIEAWGVPDGAPKLLLVMLVRILFMPVIAGISYEITVKWAGGHPDNPLVKVILWPGMQMQYLTTNEPDDSMLECAIAAMQKVLDREESEAAKAAA